MKYFFKVVDCVVEVDYERGEWEECIDREFSLLRCPPSSSDILISISRRRLNSSEHRAFDRNNNIRCIKGEIVQYFSAFLRHFYVKYKTKGSVFSVEILIPYKKRNGFMRCLSPFFEYQDESCITDFFHNVFPIILQRHLLDIGASLFHCSALIIKRNNQKIILSGGAQSGKSSLMSMLSKKTSITICAEDFAFVSLDGNVYGYPHLTRVRFKDFRDNGIKYLYGNGHYFSSLLDRLNKRLYSFVTKNENGRHFSIKELYKGHDFKRKEGLSKVYYLERGNKKCALNIMSTEDFCKVNTDIIMNEFRNMKQALELYKYLSIITGSNGGESDLRNKTYEVYQMAFANSECKKISLPYYPTVEEAVRQILVII